MYFDFVVMGYVCLGTALVAGRMLGAADVHIAIRALIGMAICSAMVSVWSWRWNV